MSKEAKTSYDISVELKNRWSPRAFENRPIEKDKLQRLFEAARWSPSASNEQPWFFIIGQNNDKTYSSIMETLVEFNQMWAKNAPVLILNCGRETNLKGDTKNTSFQYDVGQSVAFLTFQAIKEGLFIHQMAGFSPEKAKEIFEIPEGFQALTVMAIGYMGNPEMLHSRMQKSEIAERERKALDEFVFEDKFGKTSSIIENQ